MRPLVVLVVLITLSPWCIGYEWRPHNRMALWASELILKLQPDPELKNFLEGFGAKDLATRAGNLEKKTYTDEDYTEGGMLPSPFCSYFEVPCHLPEFPSLNVCTFDHFHPRLPWPIGRGNAIDHARYYFELAVNLYRAGKCSEKDQKKYFEWSARALGHALHLVQDMGSPQHTRPENHAPPVLGVIAIGHGPSFHEQWTQERWGEPSVEYPTSGVPGKFSLAWFERAAAAASNPILGDLVGIMTTLSSQSQLFPYHSPQPPGSNKLCLSSSANSRQRFQSS